jgi:hypothetical protein
VGFTLANFKGHRYTASGIGGRIDVNADPRKNTLPEQIAASRLDRCCPILICGVHQQPSANERFLDVFEAGDANVSDLSALPRGHMKGHIDEVSGGILPRMGWVDAGIGKSIVLQCPAQALPCSQHVCGHRRRSGGEVHRCRGRRRDLAHDVDRSQVIERSEIERDVDFGVLIAGPLG